MQSLPLWLLALLFLVAAGAIWRAGTRLEVRVSEISDRTGMGRAFAGMFLLATATSLPEVATTVSAIAIHDNSTLAIHNLLGGVALQTALLVVADGVARKRGALTSFAPRFVLLIQGVGLVMLLQIAVAAIAAGGAPVIGSVSLWTVVILAAHVAMMYLTWRYRGHPRWTPTPVDDYPAGDRADPADGADEADEADEADDGELEGGPPLRAIWLRFAGAAAIVLVAGWLASGAADALASRTGLGSAFFGATALALATSLPELSTTIAASRSGRYTTAISNIFGSNAFCVSLLFLADLLDRGGSVLAGASPSIIFISTVGAIMTCIYLWGLMERADRTVLGIGWDSAIALAVYTGAMAVLYVVW